MREKQQSPYFSDDNFVTKCCPANKVLDLSLNRCVITANDIQTDLFPPARMIRDTDSGLSTGHYRLNTYEGQPCPQDYQATFQTPSYVYTNGTAFFQQTYDTYSGMQKQPFHKILKKKFKVNS